MTRMNNAGQESSRPSGSHAPSRQSSTRSSRAPTASEMTYISSPRESHAPSRPSGSRSQAPDSHAPSRQSSSRSHAPTISGQSRNPPSHAASQRADPRASTRHGSNAPSGSRTTSSRNPTQSTVREHPRNPALSTIREQPSSSSRPPPTGRDSSRAPRTSIRDHPRTSSHGPNHLDNPRNIFPPEGYIAPNDGFVFHADYYGPCAGAWEPVSEGVWTHHEMPEPECHCNCNCFQVPSSPMICPNGHLMEPMYDDFFEDHYRRRRY